MLQIGYQSFKMHLFVWILGLVDEQMSVVVDQIIKVRVVIQMGGNQTLVAAMGLIIHIPARFVGKLVQQPVKGWERSRCRQKVEPLRTEKILDLRTYRRKIRFRMNFVPRFLKASKSAHGQNQGVGIRPKIRLIVQKLLGNLFDLFVTAAKINVQGGIVRIKNRRQNNVLKAITGHSAELFLFRQ